ncbi:sugar-binding protein [Streptomyces sp. NBC_01335]|uniref:RHS repeat domain-containing protein n=1 Tax=Streptomyces sp. NBC_01335 TaxID=2903828 RepID=UPI002E0D378C|nr:sugar-binding protein [Streptomyces sp. NBC_01335]
MSSVAQASEDRVEVAQPDKPLSGHTLEARPRKHGDTPKVPAAQPKHSWGSAGTATLLLPDISVGKDGVPKSAAAQSVRAGNLPISLGAPRLGKKSAKGGGAKNTSKSAARPLTGSAKVHVYGQKEAREAGVDGLLFSLTPQQGTDGDTVSVAVDYASAAQTYGGAYASRLHLVQLPACAATTPTKHGCTIPKALPSDNNTAEKTVTASSVTIESATTAATTSTFAEPMLLAATAGNSSDHGDYTATSLSASASWSTDLNTGDFSWSYDIAVPGVPGGFAPALGLGYSSGTIDGRTNNTNNQASWAGDGFDLWPGSIDRSYKPCADEGEKNAAGDKVGDLCWRDDNATISFNGHAGELIPISTNSFRIKGDDGTKVDRLYGSDTNVRGNGAHNDEYWRVTTTDGTRYYFGENRLPGWATGSPTTNSTWTAPVYGNDAGEPCSAATFADSWCQQGWRWNLDYAVDVHGNTIAYYYNKETNYYGRDLTPANSTVYDRGGSLDRIEYGLKSSANYSAKPLAKVDFTTAERCLPQSGVTCEAAGIDTQSSYWYDTPWDLNCKSGADCYVAQPSFFTRKQLTAITTSTLQADGTYAPVDTWKMNHQWGMADIDYQLELASIEHTGKAATPNLTLPKVTFTYDQRTNRLKTAGDDTAPFVKERLATIDDESGGQTDVNYSTAACDAASLPTPQTNTTLCFPQYYTKEGDSSPTLQWFNKYVVDSVTQTDRTGGAPDMITRYSYLDGAAWHHDDADGLTKEKYQSWSSFRGFGHVREQTGGQAGMKSQSDHYFLRGMDGDKAAPSGGTKSVSVSDDNGGTITDAEPHAGFEYKTENYSGPGGKVLAKTVNTPWSHQSATVTRSYGALTANLTGTQNTRTWTSLDDGAGVKWRQTSIAYTHENTAGRVTAEDDAGDTSSAADNRCTRTTYVDNTSAWILDKPSRVETVARACANTPDRTKDVLTDVRTAYDGLNYDAAPTKGDTTHVATLKSYDGTGTTATYLESATGYDSYGRTTSATDLTATVTGTETTAPVRTARTDGRTATTVYTPATGFPLSSAVTTPPAKTGDSTTAQTSTTSFEAARGLPVTVVDANSKRSDTIYDALGRKLKVWLPNRSKASSQTPNYSYAYTITDGKPVAVGTTALVGSGTLTSYTLYDGFLRARQTQGPGPSGGRLVADTFYDERGLVTKSFAPYYNNQSGPSTSLLSLTDASAVETQSWNTYDGMGRITTAKQVAGSGDGGQVLATTATAYGGDRVTTTPPTGGTPITSIDDARGNTVELDQYHASTPTGAYDKTTYAFTPAGQLAKLTDAAGNAWTYGYDQRGNQTSAADPDKGTTTSVYDERGQLVSTTDSRNKKITHVYDGLGREIETHDGDATGALLTSHAWDPTGFKGELASAIRYVGGSSGSAYTTTYSAYDSLYRPQRTTVTIPAAEGALAGSYQSSVAYNVDGSIQSLGYPKAGSLAAESVTPAYDAILRPTTLSGSGGNTYVTGTVYSNTGKALQFTYQGAGGKFTQVTNTYEWGTQRLANSRVNRQDVAGTDKSATYHYDQAGHITSVSDVSRDGTDDQCFSYDYLGRLTEAWAQGSTSCAATPSASVLGGPAKYWQSYLYDLTGNRTSETDHDTTGDTTKDVKHTFTYPAAGAAQPHALSKVTTTSPGGTATDSYTYDTTGNTKTRTVNGKKQTLTWDTEGHLASVAADNGSGGTTTTNYVYDADGNRLTADSDVGSTLFLGSTEVTLAKGSSTAKGTRYYDIGGGNTAVRTDDGKLSFLVGDHHGTGQLAIGAGDQSLQERRTTPFGAVRGTDAASWPGDRGFVGGVQDLSLGLTHLGARDYDQATGRFLSVDPELGPDDPQQLNGYSYANNNPVSASDPDGLRPIGPTDSIAGDEEYSRKHNGSRYVNNGYGWYWKNVQKKSVKHVGTVTVTTYIGRGTGNHPVPQATISFKAYKPKPKQVVFHGWAMGSNPNYSPNFDADGNNTATSVSVNWGAVGDILSGMGEAVTGILGGAAGGAGGIVLGVPMCATGVGCIAGGGELVVGGIAVADGGYLLAKDGFERAGNAGKLFSETSTDTSSGSASSETVTRSLSEPESLRGATPEELDALLGDLERTDAPHATGGGFRVRIPGGVAVVENGDNTVVNGVPKMNDITHRGPYIKFQIGKKVQRIPLAGNPALD